MEKETKQEELNQSQPSQSTSYQSEQQASEPKSSAPDTPDISSKDESANVQAYKLHRAGKNVKAIGKELHVSNNKVWDMIVAGAEELGEEPPKKRGRRPQPADVLPTKDKKGKETVSSVLSKDSVIKQVLGIHQILALVTVPEAAITESDAELLGSAIYEVIKDSDLEWLTKYEKYINLAVAAAVVEVPVALRVKGAMDAKKKKPVVKAESEDKKKDDKIRTINGIAEGEPLK
jgi:hypothetical protein